MTASDDVRAHLRRCIDYLRAYAQSQGDFTNSDDVKAAIDMAGVEIDRAALAARKLTGGKP
jgi:hypothetical protein